MNKFEPLNEFFDQIYVISLKRNLERHEKLKERLRGLDYTLSWGVDGREESISDLERRGLYNHEQYNLIRLLKGERVRPLSMGRVCCALSHVNVYKTIIQNQVDRALILEDDVIADYSKLNGFPKATGELPCDWDLFYLSFSGSNTTYGLRARVKCVSSRIANLLGLQASDLISCRDSYPRPYSTHLRRSGYHFGAFAYAVSLRGASKIFKYQSPVVREADNALAELCKFGLVNAFNLKERLFLHDYGLPSTRKAC